VDQISLKASQHGGWEGIDPGRIRSGKSELAEAFFISADQVRYIATGKGGRAPTHRDSSFPPADTWRPSRPRIPPC
jgi:hypothetical protein